VAEATPDVSAEVVDLGSAWPIDPGLAARVRRTGRLVVVAPPGEAAWGQRVVAEVLGGAFLHFEAPPAVVALRDLSRALRDAVAW